MSLAQLAQEWENAKENTLNTKWKHQDALRKEETQKLKLDILLKSFSQTDLDEIHQWIDCIVEKSQICWNGTRKFVFCAILPWIWNQYDSRGLHVRNECISSSYKEIVTPPEKIIQLFARLHIDWVVEEYDEKKHKC